ncbi:MAG TPA: Uma2 family endonuclease [Bryobacteraceae bacterium]|jgi:Uma2 family endonuclease
MGATTAKILLSAEEFDNYPFEEDKRYELDEGELIEMTRPAYKHNRVLQRLTGKLFVYLEGNPVGEMMISENLYALSRSTRRAPDLAIILGDHREELKDATVIPVIPDIAVEVLSPSESTRSIHRKLKQYFAAGVKEVWIVDPETATAEIWTGTRLPEHELSGADALTSVLLPGFALPLTDLFA